MLIAFPLFFHQMFAADQNKDFNRLGVSNNVSKFTFKNNKKCTKICGRVQNY